MGRWSAIDTAKVNFLFSFQIQFVTATNIFFSSPALSRPPSALATTHIENAEARLDAMMPVGGPSHENANAGNLDEGPEDDANFNEQTTLLNNEEESFALAPVDASALKGTFDKVVLKICVKTCRQSTVCNYLN